MSLVGTVPVIHCVFSAHARITIRSSLIDGFSRAVVHSEIREKMEEIDIETILQRANEEHPNEKPRVITDNGPQFISS
jgi:transposase InsO family protein